MNARSRAQGNRRRSAALWSLIALTALIAALAAVTFAIWSRQAAEAPPAVGEGRFDALVVTETAGFVHPSIPDGVAAITTLGEAHDFSVTVTGDSAGFFTAESLGTYEVVIFLNTTGDMLDSDEEAAFEDYIRGGGGYAGVHSASDTEFNWQFYRELVGAYFASDPAPQNASLLVEDPGHPSTSSLPTELDLFEEWYNFDVNPRDDVHVVLSVDEDSYEAGDGSQGFDHPVAWCQSIDAGRSWYTALGNEPATYLDTDFLAHLLGGIEAAAGAVVSDCDATDEEAYDLVALDTSATQPMELDIADDGRVFYVERAGGLKVINVDGSVDTMLSLDVSPDNEAGLLGIALDPDFAVNRHLYLYWSPNGGDADRLSRFTVDESFESVDAGTEVVMLEVPVLNICCHNGGALEFDNEGNLFVTTGDNTNPFESQGYTPIDEQSGREGFDAQRTSANTNSLSGKILRITPQPDGSYTIPEGNLFAPGTADTRPEIYLMGMRNPFRIGLDPLTNNLIVADFGPDAGTANADRGPEGRVEWSIVGEAGNHGWPYCHAYGVYQDWDFATETSSGVFDCDNPVNESPNNTGITELPPVVDPDVWYGKMEQTDWPVFGTGGAPMGGPVYRYDPELESDVQWPEYFDGKSIFGEWSTPGEFYTIQLDDAGGEVLNIVQLFNADYISQPMAMEFGPDGALYVIDWGGGADGGVYRIEYRIEHLGDAGGGPSAIASADVTSGPAPLEVQFDASGSSDSGGSVTFAWDLDGDGVVDSTDVAPSFTYESGHYQALLRVTDGDGNEATDTITITSGNTAPEVSITWPVEGGFAEFGDTIGYAVEVRDPEDGVEVCDRVLLTPELGHDDHGHPGPAVEGCEGQFEAIVDDSHGPEADVYIIVGADYTDLGGTDDVPALSGSDTIILQPKFKQAQYFDETGKLEGYEGIDDGVSWEATEDDGGFQSVAYIDNGDYWSYSPVNLVNITGLTARVASATAGGTLEFRWNSPEDDAPLIGSVVIPNTGAWQSFVEISLDFDTVPTGTGTLYLVAKDTTGDGDYLFNVNWLEFIGDGVTS